MLHENYSEDKFEQLQAGRANNVILGSFDPNPVAYYMLLQIKLHLSSTRMDDFIVVSLSLYGCTIAQHYTMV